MTPTCQAPQLHWSLLATFTHVTLPLCCVETQVLRGENMHHACNMMRPNRGKSGKCCHLADFGCIWIAPHSSHSNIAACLRPPNLHNSRLVQQQGLHQRQQVCRSRVWLLAPLAGMSSHTEVLKASPFQDEPTNAGDAQGDKQLESKHDDGEAALPLLKSPMFTRAPFILGKHTHKLGACGRRGSLAGRRGTLARILDSASAPPPRLKFTLPCSMQ